METEAHLGHLTEQLPSRNSREMLLRAFQDDKFGFFLDAAQLRSTGWENNYDALAVRFSLQVAYGGIPESYDPLHDEPFSPKLELQVLYKTSHPGMYHYRTDETGNYQTLSPERFDGSHYWHNMANSEVDRLLQNMTQTYRFPSSEATKAAVELFVSQHPETHKRVAKAQADAVLPLFVELERNRLNTPAEELDIHDLYDRQNLYEKIWNALKKARFQDAEIYNYLNKNIYRAMQFGDDCIEMFGEKAVLVIQDIYEHHGERYIPDFGEQQKAAHTRTDEEATCIYAKAQENNIQTTLWWNKSAHDSRKVKGIVIDNFSSLSTTDLYNHIQTIRTLIYPVKD